MWPAFGCEMHAWPSHLQQLCTKTSMVWTDGRFSTWLRRRVHGSGRLRKYGGRRSDHSSTETTTKNCRSTSRNSWRFQVCWIKFNQTACYSFEKVSTRKFNADVLFHHFIHSIDGATCRTPHSALYGATPFPEFNHHSSTMLTHGLNAIVYY